MRQPDRSRLLVIVSSFCLALCCASAAWSDDHLPMDLDTSDWDWGTVEEMDDTPLTSEEAKQVQKNIPGTQRLTIEQVTAPDLDAESHSVYPLFPDMPEFQVIASIKDGEMHPCASCHKWVKSNPTPRTLNTPHNNFSLDHGLHGKGKFWCSTCHDMQNSGMLRTLEGKSVNFEEAYLVCSQCHVEATRDWAFGAHGKRLANWQGERQVYNCTSCHYQHSPAIRTRQAMVGPEMRQGLERPAHWSGSLVEELENGHAHRPWQPRKGH